MPCISNLCLLTEEETVSTFPMYMIYLAMVTVLSLLYPKVHSRQNVSGKDGYRDWNSDGCCVTRNTPEN